MFYFEGYTSHTKVSWSRIILIRVYHIIFCAAKQRKSCTFTSFPPNEHHRVQVLPVTRRRLRRGKEDLIVNYKLLLSLSLSLISSSAIQSERMADKQESTSSPLNQLSDPDDDVAKSPPNSPNSSTRKVSYPL
jgi:hypothetical protein